MKRTSCLLLCIALSIGYAHAQYQRNVDTIVAQMQFSARSELLDKYYPKDIDTAYGGYLSTFTFDFEPSGAQDKMIVTQARHVWSTAKAATYYHDTAWLAMSAHGFRFLRDKMWDKAYGGFFNLVGRDGTPKEFVKQAYGNAFAVYGLSAYYEASHNKEALDLAKKGFYWLEKHSHDSRYSGYFQYMERDGTPIRRDAQTPMKSDIGYKDQNSSIHILEALTELYHVWPDALVRKRLQEMLLLIRDRIVTPRGNLQLYFTPEWKPVSFRDSTNEAIRDLHYLDHVSFGHDVETAFLLLEASQTLGIKDDSLTRAIGKKMVDHALDNGWDSTVGGFYDEGYYFKGKDAITITLDTKNWWAQAEGLNSLLLMHQQWPDDAHHYYEHFVKLWQYVQTYLIDHKYGDWYQEGIDKSPAMSTALKAQIWKGTYHNFRAFMNCITRLRDIGDGKRL